ncbi:MAG: alpha/beta hydrolase [Planctomycetaceae bacterium]
MRSRPAWHANPMCCLLTAAILLAASLPGSATAAEKQADTIIDIWSDTPPGPKRDVGQEQDFTKDTDRLIAGRRIIKLGNVATPQAHVFLPPEDKRSGAAIVVCPGGGYSILAWDLEGTEVAEWLNTAGITAVVLKYRVPTRDQEQKWLAPVQDAQRTISLVRHHADDWGLSSDRIGILGFSAGGDTAARAALADHRHYDAQDDADQQPCRPDAAMLIYPGYLANEDRSALQSDLVVSKSSPRMFLVHAFDDGVPAESSLLMLQALKKAGVPSELHIYDAGGHGYGLRPVDEFPVTTWNHPCSSWLKRNGWTK